MSRKASIVVGLGFGDEGKGLTTDYLCSQAQSPLVIRFNGGQQAGHTVMMPDGRRHVFSSFGSGTLRGAPTYWSAYCTCALPNMLRELEALQKIQASPQLLLDIDCAVTSHYDVLYNRLLEKQRGDTKHGSCGMGFGTTLERQQTGVSFKVNDLLQAEACGFKLKQIRQYYLAKAATELKIDFNDFDHAQEDARFHSYLKQFHQLMNRVFFITHEREVFRDTRWGAFIFEGAQGILLDMDSGYFPHVTRSNTTSKNALEIIGRNRESMADPELYYVSRCYHTRHGEGPFVQPTAAFSLVNNEAETNVFNQHQGNFKTGPIDISQVNYALDCDNVFSNCLPKNLVLTCADQVDTNAVLYSSDAAINMTTLENLPALFNQDFEQVWISSHACSRFLTERPIAIS